MPEGPELAGSLRHCKQLLEAAPTCSCSPRAQGPTIRNSWKRVTRSPHKKTEQNMAASAK